MSKSQPESDDFLDAMQGVKPLPKSNHRFEQKKSIPTLSQLLKRQALERESNKQFHGLSLELTHPVDTHDPIIFKKDGIQEGVFKNLRLGKYQIESTLNLSGSVEKIRDHLLENVHVNHEKGVRCLLIRFGSNKPNKTSTNIRSYLNQWLRSLPEVIAFHSAITPHGGLGACYVLLKKNKEQKLNNRELHQKRKL